MNKATKRQFEEVAVEISKANGAIYALSHLLIQLNDVQYEIGEAAKFRSAYYIDGFLHAVELLSDFISRCDDKYLDLNRMTAIGDFEDATR